MPVGGGKSRVHGLCCIDSRSSVITDGYSCQQDLEAPNHLTTAPSTFRLPSKWANKDVQLKSRVIETVKTEASSEPPYIRAVSMPVSATTTVYENHIGALTEEDASSDTEVEMGENTLTEMMLGDTLVDDSASEHITQ